MGIYERLREILAHGNTNEMQARGLLRLHFEPFEHGAPTSTSLISRLLEQDSDAVMCALCEQRNGLRFQTEATNLQCGVWLVKLLPTATRLEAAQGLLFLFVCFKPTCSFEALLKRAPSSGSPKPFFSFARDFSFSSLSAFILFQFSNQI